MTRRSPKSKQSVVIIANSRCIGDSGPCDSIGALTLIDTTLSAASFLVNLYSKERLMREFNKDRFYFVLLISLQVADWAFTLTGIYSFGTDVEGNVLFRFLFQHFHWIAVITFFKAVMVVGCFYLYKSRRYGAVRLGAIYYFLIVFCPWVYGLGVLTRR